VVKFSSLWLKVGAVLLWIVGDIKGKEKNRCLGKG